MALGNDLDKMLKGGDKIIAEAVVNLEAELIRRTPVDTGDLKASWETQKISDGSWLLSANTNYADIIFNGRRQVPAKGGGMKWAGSIQLPDGVSPILQDHNNELEKRLKLLKG